MRHIYIPLGIAIFALFATFLLPERFAGWEDDAEVLAIIRFSPYIFFALTAILGITLNQKRILFFTLIFAVIYVAISTEFTADYFSVSNATIAKILSITTPLSLVFILLLREWKTWSAKGILSVLYVVCPPAIFLFAIKFNKVLPNEIVSWNFLPENEFIAIPQISILLLIGAVILIKVFSDSSIKSFTQSIFIAIIPLFSALQIACGVEYLEDDKMAMFSFNFAALSLIMLLSIYTLYWQKIYLDDLTEVYNRRAFNEDLERLGYRYTIVVTDIDNFKSFNDKYGHTSGDDVLKFVAQKLRDSFVGKVYRFGGEEFTIIFNDSFNEEMLEDIDSVREEIADHPFYLRKYKKVEKHTPAPERAKNGGDKKKVKITISVGVAGYSGELHGPVAVLNAADKALYKAKKTGKNKVCTA